MKKILLISVVVLLLLSSIFPITFSCEISSNGIIYVDDDNIEGPWDGTLEYPFQYIQDGIDASVDGETVYVYSGFYKEYIYVNKSIILKGEDKNKTVINAVGQYSDIIFIMKDFVYISNFTIQNLGTRLDVVHDGVILSCTNVTISNINFIGCGLSFEFLFGISGMFHNQIINTYVDGKPLLYLEDKTEDIVDFPCGQVILVDCDNITISHQNLSDLRCGIVLYRSHNCYLYQNQIINSSYGIVLFLSNDNTVLENKLSRNSGGIIYTYSHDNRFIKNIIESNGIGINDNLSPYLSSSNNVNVIENMFMNNSWGLAVWLTSDITIMHNDIKNNGEGIVILTCLFPSRSDIVYNNFYSNRRSVYILEDPEDISNIFIDGNYWGKPRFLPKPIFGRIKYASGIFTNYPWFFIDRNPASEPNNISC